MKSKQRVTLKSINAICLTTLGFSFGGCTTMTNSNYAYRNNIDSARSRCMQVARSSGYKEVAVESAERDGQAEWKVGVIVNKEGKNRKEHCEYNATTDRVRLG